MRRNQQHLLLLWSSISILGALTLSPVLLGQASPDSEAAMPLPTDWSHQHLIFSRPATLEQAERVQQDPRYWQQLRRHTLAKQPEAETSDAFTSGLRPIRVKIPLRDTNHELKPDWSEALGGGGTVGAGNYPAKYNFNNIGSASCSDFVVYSTGLVPGAAKASIVAFDNLYAGCGATVPTVYWAYDTKGQILTSPVFSRDGKQVAFAQIAAAKASLVLLKWAASAAETITTPGVLTAVSPALYATCAAPPCMTALALTDAAVAANDTNSSPFYDYTPANDTAYLGDNSGWLHKFHPVFNAAPAEVKTGGWPVHVNPGSAVAAAPLTNPVHDSVTGNVFVEDKGGFLYWVSPAGAVTKSGQLDFSVEFDGGPGFVQGPIVDSTLGIVYAFATSDGSLGCPVGVGGFDCTVVYQTNTSFSAGDVPPRAIVGTSTAHGTVPNPLYIGAFDSSYENSGDPPTGNLYVCGNTGGPPTLYQVPITAGVFGTVLKGPALSTAGTTACSPVTDIMNPNTSPGPTEWVFLSAQKNAVSNLTGCAVAVGGCIYNAKDTPWEPSTAYAVGQEVLDSHFQIQVVETAGTSNTTAPAWSATTAGVTGDNSVVWLNQGPLSGTMAISPWGKNNGYLMGTLIFDSNHNIEFCIFAFGNSGGFPPTWKTAPGAITGDNAVVWENLGPDGTAALATNGGTSGIIIDNTVGSGPLVGSQVYFSTLKNQAACGTPPATTGCAVQASQTALK